MNYKDNYQLTYCTNIHPGETWAEVMASLQDYLPALKARLSPDAPFGVGLRLSDLASRELLEENKLDAFKRWLISEDLYVFTMNGFPFGGFHHQVVKDAVHKPDWTTRERLDYTIRLAQILAVLLPEGMEGGISTSPLSYKPWHTSADATEEVFRKSTEHLAELTGTLLQIKEKTGKTIHIDIEPEPDGVLENTEEVIRYYNNWLLPFGGSILQQQYKLSPEQAKEAILAHIQLCYDVCHFALAYEQPEVAFAQLKAAGISIGKIQLSAALKTAIPESINERELLAGKMAPFVESTYLHQVVARNNSNQLAHFPDLTEALENLEQTDAVEWRTHFHVPLFTDAYNGLQSTQDDIKQVLNILESNAVTSHLEVETYTWDVLPQPLKLDLTDSIQREMEWVLNHTGLKNHA